MNKYLIPVCDLDDIYIISVSARSISEAKDKFISEICEIYKLDCIMDWDSFLDLCDAEKILIGNIYDIEEF
jgi:hypothetical protein